jgi:hypothetical protein
VQLTEKTDKNMSNDEKICKCENLHIDKIIIQWYYNKNKCDVGIYYVALLFVCHILVEMGTTR